MNNEEESDDDKVEKIDDQNEDDDIEKLWEQKKENYNEISNKKQKTITKRTICCEENISMNSNYSPESSSNNNLPIDNKVEVKSKNISDFYENLHYEESDDFEDVEWQSASDNDIKDDLIITDKISQHNDIEKVNDSRPQPSVLTTAVMDRAVHTASNMADWAGRAVRHALKEHMKSIQDKEVIISPNSDNVNQILTEQTHKWKNSVDHLSTDIDKDVRTTTSKSINYTEIDFNDDSENNLKDNDIEVDKTENVINESAVVHESSHNSSPDIINTYLKENFEVDNDIHGLTSDNNNSNRTRNIYVNDDFIHKTVENSQNRFESELLSEAMEEEKSRRNLFNAKRDTESLTEEMKQEVIELIKAFNLPFIIAPFEAEAQCAVLEQLGLVDGVVTEDSDTFLFGAKTVYRNIFVDKKFAEV